jgi:hypothetical protein
MLKIISFSNIFYKISILFSPMQSITNIFLQKNNFIFFFYLLLHYFKHSFKLLRNFFLKKYQIYSLLIL